MQVAHTIAELLAFRRDVAQRLTVEVGLVMTMGALHAGHRSLIARARRENPFLIATIFVNPRQFGPNEDLSRYPRPLDADLALCRSEGVDCVFVPSVAEIYPAGFGTEVVPPVGLTKTLCGLARPGHFTGVATVVARVINLVQPSRAYFGQKDAQQVAVLRRVATDLHLPGNIVVCPTVRDPDGLALSSRNAYLSPEQRRMALAIPQSLAKARILYEAGVLQAETLLGAVRHLLDSEPELRPEYVALVDPDDLTPIAQVDGTGLLAVAARVGGTRLIDNVLLGQTLAHPPLIAIDGPAGAGKSTLARRLALALGFLYIDTGAMYRAVTWKALQAGIDPTDGERLAELTRRLSIRLAPGYLEAFPTRVWVDGEEVTRAVREERVSLQVSAASAHLGVRTELVKQQRELGSQGGVILDGRDIGTHVFPDAQLKIFLTASVAVRAGRRAEDLRAKGHSVPSQSELEVRIHRRDEQDSTRTHAPLRKAPDAVEVSTDGRTIEQTLAYLLELCRVRLGLG